MVLPKVKQSGMANVTPAIPSLPFCVVSVPQLFELPLILGIFKIFICTVLTCIEKRALRFVASFPCLEL